MPLSGALEEKARRVLDARRPAILAASRWLYEHPELSGEEHRSASHLVELLRKNSFEVEAPLGSLPTAFRATRRGRRDRPRVTFLAEYDALPGVGHGCAHNFIGAASVGAGLVLGELASELDGSVLVIGTPAEETVGGKVILLEEGVFRDVDAAMMFHAAAETRVNTTSLASQSFEVTFYGKEAHAAAAPEQGVNALDALVAFYLSLDMLKKQLRKDVRIPGIVVEGGLRPNIVPALARGAFSARASDSAYLDYVLARVRENAESAAKAHGARVELRHVERRYEDMRSNQALAEVCASHLEKAGYRLVRTPRERMGSLDMGNLSHAFPCIHPMIAICDDLSAHTREFGEASLTPRGEKALLDAVWALAMTAAEFLQSPELAERARREFESGRGSTAGDGR
jgi:amidohydrolase